LFTLQGIFYLFFQVKLQGITFAIRHTLVVIVTMQTCEDCSNSDALTNIEFQWDFKPFTKVVWLVLVRNCISCMHVFLPSDLRFLIWTKIKIVIMVLCTYPSLHVLRV